MPNPPVGDHTSLLQRLIIRRKTSGAMELTDLLASEFCLGNTEQALFVRSPDGLSLYQFGRIKDTTSTDFDTVWSGLFTKNYIDNSIDNIVFPEPEVPTKTILFTAGGIVPLTTGGCSEPAVMDNTGTPIISADFTSGQSGFWNISIPGDYTGNISKISILYTGSDSTCEWEVKAKVLADSNDVVTDGSWSNTYTLVDDPPTANKLQKIELSDTMPIFGSSSNAGNFASILITLALGTGTYNLLQVKFEYQ